MDDEESMPFDPLSCDPVLLDAAVVWVHMPSGAAALQGIVRHPDGGPILGGPAVHPRPVSTGGTRALLPGVDLSQHGRLPSQPALWPDGTTEKALAAALEQGWRVLTRAEAVRILAAQLYRLRGSDQPGHILHSDQADERTWHPRQNASGRQSTYLQVVFVARSIGVPDTPAPLLDADQVREP